MEQEEPDFFTDCLSAVLLSIHSDKYDKRLFSYGLPTAAFILALNVGFTQGSIQASTTTATKPHVYMLLSFGISYLQTLSYLDH